MDIIVISRPTKPPVLHGADTCFEERNLFKADTFFDTASSRPRSGFLATDPHEDLYV